MKIVAVEKVNRNAPSTIETFALSRDQFDFLGRLGLAMNPNMPMEFAGAHVIRTLLERFEESDIDLTAASSEEELTRLAASGLQGRR